jgi:uncharacterized protein (DUF1697 family)
MHFLYVAIFQDIHSQLLRNWLKTGKEPIPGTKNWPKVEKWITEEYEKY